MPSTVTLSKADARRAFARHHFTTSPTMMDAFERLRSVQFDPLAPVGANHDLVLQARVPGYKIGDWEKITYEDRRLYDGWDKQASLVPLEGWPLRRLFHTIYREGFDKKIFQDHKDAVEAILKNLEERGPLLPKECDFQLRKEEWKGSWLGPSVTKQTLRALWHSGLVMTAGRKSGQHLYDLTERIVPKHLLEQPRVSDWDAICELVYERHLAMGIIRPAAPYEIWSYSAMGYRKREAMARLVAEDRLVPVEVEGVKAHATKEFLAHLDDAALEPRVVFVAPLDQILWDRKMIAHVFGFDYCWEVYTPEVKRRWGYYVLPVWFGEAFVGRVEFWCRDGVLEMRQWHYENGDPGTEFWVAFEKALREFMNYCSASRTTMGEGIDTKVRDLVLSLSG